MYLPFVELSSTLLLPTNTKPLNFLEFVAIAKSAGVRVTNPPFGIPFGIADEIERQSRPVTGAWFGGPPTEVFPKLEVGWDEYF